MYTVTVTGDKTQGYTITNSHDATEISVSAKKVWNDNNNQDGKRADVTFELQVNGAAVEGQEQKTIAANATTEAARTVSWTGLPKYLNGAEIAYTVKEIGEAEGQIQMISGDADSVYTVTVTGDKTQGYTITNKHVPVTTSIVVTKEWIDQDNTYNLRLTESTTPKFSTKLHLMNGMEEVMGFDPTITLVEGDNNKLIITYSGMPKYALGSVVLYSVLEDSINGYNTTGSPALNNTTITNSLSTSNVTVTKIWEDSNNANNTRPEKITFRLWQNTSELYHVDVTPDSEGKWNDYTWTGLPAKDQNGDPYTYQVTEDAVADYTTEFTTATSENGKTYSFTNSIKKSGVTVTKKFVSIEKKHIPNSFVITTDYSGYEELKLAAATPSSGDMIYTWSIPDVPVGTVIHFEEAGYESDYYDVETTPAKANGKVSRDLKVSTDGPNSVEFENKYTRKKAKIDVKKIVSGNMGDIHAVFNFNAVFTMTNGTSRTETFQLSHNGVKTFDDIEWGTKVEIKEETTDDYLTSSGTEENNLNENQHQVEIAAVRNSYYKVTFENNKNVQVDTGVPLDLMPYAMILVAVLLGAGGLGFGIRRRRRFE